MNIKKLPRNKEIRCRDGSRRMCARFLCGNYMRKIVRLIVIVLFALATYRCSNSSNGIPSQKRVEIEKFLRNAVAETLKEDYRSHNIDIEVLVTGLKIDLIKKKETDVFISYLSQGRVSYIIKGKREWIDKEGNIVRLDPEEEITHWFGCGVLEDRYGDLLRDGKNRLTFYADNPNL